MFFAKARSSVRGEERYGAPPLLVGIGPCTTGGVGANLVVKDGVDGVGGGGWGEQGSADGRPEQRAGSKWFRDGESSSTWQ